MIFASFADFFFSPTYSKVVGYLIIGFIALFVVMRFMIPSLKPAIEAKIIAFVKKRREKKNGSTEE